MLQNTWDTQKHFCFGDLSSLPAGNRFSNKKAIPDLLSLLVRFLMFPTVHSWYSCVNLSFLRLPFHGSRRRTGATLATHADAPRYNAAASLCFRDTMDAILTLLQVFSTSTDATDLIQCPKALYKLWQVVSCGKLQKVVVFCGPQTTLGGVSSEPNQLNQLLTQLSDFSGNTTSMSRNTNLLDQQLYPWRTWTTLRLW